MAEDNKDKLLQNKDDDALDEAPKTEMTGDDWTWDAAVPELASDDITLGEIADSVEKSAENKSDDKISEKENEKEENVCIVCGNSLKDSTGELYCESCCEKFLKRNLGVGSIILAFVMVIVAAIGYFVCVSTCRLSENLTKTTSLVSKADYDGAIDEYSAALNTVDTLNSGVNAIFTGINENFNTVDWFNEGDAITKTALEAYADIITINYSDRSSFVAAVDEAFSQDKLSSRKYAKIKACYDFCIETDKISESVAEKWQEYIYGDGSENYVIPYDETLKYLDSVEQNSACAKSIISYYKFMTAYYTDKDADTTLAFMKQAYDEAGDFGYMFVSSYMNAAWNFKDYDLLNTLTQTALKRNPKDTLAEYYSIKSAVITGDFDAANNFCEQIKANDPESLTYYSMKAEVLRREGKYEEAAKICDEGLKIGTDAELNRQQAIAYMLNGDKDSAVAAAGECYNNALTAAYSGSTVSLESFYTAAIITKLCGDEDTYKEINDLLVSEGIDYSDSAKACLDGKVSFEDTFMKGTGDIV